MNLINVVNLPLVRLPAKLLLPPLSLGRYVLLALLLPATEEERLINCGPLIVMGIRFHQLVSR